MRQATFKRLLTWLWLLAAALSLLACVLAYYRKGEVDLVPVIVTLLLATVGISSAHRKGDTSESDSFDHENKPPDDASRS